ncbi:amidophosphoribosyltransferase, partial [Chamaesiphon polymorphus]
MIPDDCDPNSALCADLVSPNDDNAVDKPEEACGVFGIYAPGQEVAKLTYFGLYALQHRGQESAGIATFDNRQLHEHRDMGLVSHVFNPEILEQLPGQLAIGHTRYSTTGSSRRCNAQPVIVDTILGKLALAHNGNLVNTGALRDYLVARGCEPTTTIDSEMIALIIREEVNAGKSWVEATIAACSQCVGAFSLTIATPDGIMAIRDPYGIRPLVLGVMPDRIGHYVVASETCALDIIGADYERDIKPGELLWITAQGIEAIDWAPKTQPKLCIFEMIYFARPDSWVNEESLYSYRMRLGKQLAKESFQEADIVIGVPDSGIPAAIGFSETSGIHYAEGLIKNRYVGRTFIQPTQEMRESGIRMKLNPLRDVLNGKRVIVIDDSIVRGTTSRKLVKALRDAGATEIHMRISSPPVTHPCFYGIDTDTQDQLIAATKSVTEIARQIGVDTLEYLSWEGMLAATNQDPKNFCSACFTGDYPVDIPDGVKKSKLML